MGIGEIIAIIAALTILVAVIIVLLRYWAGIVTFDLVQYERVAVFKTTGEFIGIRGPGRVRIKPVLLFFSSTGEVVRDENGDPVTKADVEQGKGKFDLREQAAYPQGGSHLQHCITADSAVVTIEPAVVFQITDPAKLVLNIKNHITALRNAIKATLLAVVGTMTLTEVITGREHIASATAVRLSEQAERWGISLISVEIQDIHPAEEVEASMNERRAAEEMAERDRQDLVVRAEARRQGAAADNEAAIARAEMEKQTAVAQAEAYKQAAITRAEGDRAAEILKAEGVAALYKALMELGDGADIALRYEQIQALRNLGESSNSKLVIVPANLAAVNNVAQLPLIEGVIPPTPDA